MHRSARAATHLLIGGIDVGIEVYLARRIYVSVAVGWVHPVYRGVDFAALSSTSPALIYRDIATDAFTFKLGFGI